MLVAHRKSLGQIFPTSVESPALKLSSTVEGTASSLGATTALEGKDSTGFRTQRLAEII